MDNKKRPIWHYILLIIGCLSFYILPFCFLGWLSIIDTEGKIEKLKTGEFSIDHNVLVVDKDVESKYLYSDSTFYIYGYLKNNSNKDVEYLSMEYELYDKNDNILGAANAYIESLPKGKKWKFKATYSDIDAKEVQKYKLIKVDYSR